MVDVKMEELINTRNLKACSNGFQFPWFHSRVVFNATGGKDA